MPEEPIGGASAAGQAEIEHAGDSGQLLAALFDAAVDAIVVTDAAGRILRANAAAETIFGHASGTLIGQDVSVLIPGRGADAHPAFMARYAETGTSRIVGTGREVEGQHSDGTRFPLHLSLGEAALEGQTAFIGILRDLRPRRATEAALARSQRLDAIGHMTSGIAHDFNNMLTVIIGNLELLQRRITSERELGLLNEALTAAELGSDLTAQLLAFARKDSLHPEPFDLNKICRNALGLLRRTLGTGYTIRTHLAETAQMVQTDPTQLQAAIVNLALNARDAMPTGGTLSIETATVHIDDAYVAQETDVAQGDYVCLTVTDAGAGMSPESQARAFEPFYTTKGPGHGTGLGLWIVYGFVRQSGGHVALYSEPGQGTSVSLCFPALAVSDGDEVEPRDAHAHAMGRGECVLVVEDNDAVRRLTVERIRALGYETLEACNGETGLTLALNTPGLALMLTDLVMPGTLSGMDLAHRVARERPEVGIVLASGYSEDFAGAGSPEPLPFPLLRKPYRQSDLAWAFQSLLSPDPRDRSPAKR